MSQRPFILTQKQSFCKKKYFGKAEKVEARNGEGKTVCLYCYRYCGDPLHFNQLFEMNETQARELLSGRILLQEMTVAEYLVNGFDIHTVGRYPEIEATIRDSLGTAY